MLEPGFHEVPRGMVATIVTHLEMRQPANTGPVSNDWVFHRHHHASPDWYRSIFSNVGRDWLWFSRLHLSDDDLTAVIHHPDYELWTLRIDGVDLGLIELDHRTPDACELAFFGVTPQMVGKGAGRAMIQHAIARAFTRNISRFHVHTCTLDSPQALGFYIKAGFTPIKQEVEIAPDPRLTGYIERDAAPQIPVFA
ncbi:GNAT family N-acetyltransferase [Loktanella sp. S4079]|uniref:GNAT family N-acetyltransferase n=1 Tax=Loktanella sp. S4079 TaxID=579483 RepID=UPI0005FA1FAA|nr:GNAT family N-acetyltransferase [Loktanella sp. S4079]KJZ19988.1 GCN5 family acetyltransferase [Loktanella sp. S4079]